MGAVRGTRNAVQLVSELDSILSSADCAGALKCAKIWSNMIRETLGSHRIEEIEATQEFASELQTCVHEQWNANTIAYSPLSWLRCQKLASGHPASRTARPVRTVARSVAGSL